MTTLASATLDLARILMDCYEGVATNGSTTTLEDTLLNEVDQFFNDGTIWFLSGNNAGKSAYLTSWALATHLFTFPTMGLACANGNLYSVAASDWPKRVLAQMVNRALVDIGAVPAFDTSLSVVADQETYTLPAAVSNVKRVEVAYTSTAPYLYTVHQGWREFEDALYFDTYRAPQIANMKIRLTYQTVPSAPLTLDTAAISDLIHPSRLAWKAAVHALRWRSQRTRDDRPDLVRLLNESVAKEMEMDRRYPVPEIRPDTHTESFPEEPYWS